MNENQTIELQIKSSSESAMQSLNNLSKSILDIEKNISSIHLRLGQIDSKTKSVSTIENVLTNIYLDLGKIETKLNTISSKSKNSIMNINSYYKATDNSTKKLESNFSRLNNVISYVSFKRFFQTISSWMQDAINYTEQLNLFNVVFKNIKKNGEQTFSSLGLEATRYQNKLNEAFGTNKTETLYMQAMFESMGENAGIKEQYASIMSKTMTNLTYDLASLYNKSEKDVAEALRAGVYAGQTKPLRSYGIDVTQNTMTPLLQAMGIDDRTVSDLSYAEKEILRYIATLKQAQVAMGDMANTIESPSNQLKVFRQQLVEAKVALSSLFINAFSKILPYANAILMVIKEVSRAIASFFGIKLTDYNTSIALNINPNEDYADSLDDVSDNAGRARKAVKELKREILGFDQINNINEPKDNTGSGGSGYVTSGGIDQRLLDAIRGYDNGLDKVRMKAAEIRDKIMEWLGFTKQIDPLTGEISWKFTNTNSTIYKIVTALKDIIKYGKEAISGVFGVIKKDFDNGIFGKILVGIFETIANLFKFIAKNKSVQTIIAKVVEAFLLFKTVKTVLKPVVLLYGTLVTKVQNGANHIKNFVNQLKGTNNYIRDANGNLKEYNKTIAGHSNVILNADGSINKWETGISKAKTALSGLVSAIIGINTLKDAMKSLSNEGPNVANVFEAIVGSLTTIFGFTSIGSMFGPVGTAIGAVTGSVVALVTALSSYEDSSKKIVKQSEKELEVSKNKLKSYADSKKAIEDVMNANLAHTGYHEVLLTELENMIDANGRLKSGYEDRANFILTTLNKAYGTEYTLLDLQNGKINEIRQSIVDLIQAKKTEIILEAEKENYQNALEKERQAYYDYSNAVKKYNETNEKGLKVLEKKNEMEKIAGTQAFKNYTYTSELTGETYKGAYAYMQITNDLKTYDEKLKNNEKTMLNYKDTWKKYKTDIIYYEDLETAVLNNDVEKQKQIIDDRLNHVVEANNGEKLTLSDKLQYAQDSYDTLLKIYKDNGIKITDEVKNQALSQLEETSNGLLNQTKEVKDGKYTKELIDAWRTLGELNETKFLEKFKELPNDVQKQVVDKMQSKGYSISEELQKGISKINPNIFITSNVQDATVNVNANTKPAINTINDFINNLNKRIEFNILTKKAKGGAFYGGMWHNIKQYANGGMPSHGSMFIAGERGAEIVGNINGRTEVLNQSQIASTIYNAMISAMNQFSGSSSQIDVHVHSDEGVIVDKINQRTKQTGVCPISIPF